MSRRHPLVGLVAVAAVPAAALAGVWWWADAQVPAAVEPPPTTVPPAPNPPLRTALTDWRRLPGPVADQAAERAGRAALVPVADSIPDGSCLAVRDADGTVLAAANASVPVIPASNQKVVTAAVALEVLGSDHRFVTEVRGGPIGPDGTLTGDLHLVGGGDPLLASADVRDDDTHPAFNTTSFDALADQLVAAGLRRVTGDLVADGTRYDEEFVLPTWGPAITRAEGGPIGALLVNDGRIVGSGVGLDPNQAAAAELNRLLTARGVAIDGRNRTDPAPDLPVLARVESAPLRDVVDELLTTSDNNTAEMLVKELGYATAGVGTTAAGLAAMRDVLAAWEVPLDGIVLADGSGLSRENRLTCDVLLAVLGRHDDDDPLVTGLPVAGLEGTMRDELADSEAAGRLRAKTGTLTDVKALTGRLDDGDRYDVAVVLNGPGVSDPASRPYRATWRSLVDAVLAGPFGPDASTLGPR
ncbi:MAG: D-alanyl-D-alanine carboxypeptidase/D-alanyl-D-alanine-endopeptidase [Ilumatobacteraceae bacterium]|nr:D-alanyl-D-alanine carboxypeptidase/D-alanyl-D-alanine-endopeptidase [Ilumatobacteraceae bacterium]